MADVTAPSPKRLRVIFSALINLARFRAEKSELAQDYAKKSSEVAQLAEAEQKYVDENEAKHEQLRSLVAIEIHPFLPVAKVEFDTYDKTLKVLTDTQAAKHEAMRRMKALVEERRLLSRSH